MSNILLGRDFLLRAGTLEFKANLPAAPASKRLPDLSFSFKIVKGISRDANKNEIVIRNLSRNLHGQSQAAFTTKGSPIILEAGYPNLRGLIFQGKVVSTETTYNGKDWITRIQANDGGEAIKKARTGESLPPGAKVGDALKKCVDKLSEFGIGPGNLDKKIAELKTGQLTEYINGKVLAGSTADCIDEIVNSVGQEWSIQDEKFQMQASNEINPDLKLIVTPTTGLVGSPEAGEEGRIKWRQLLDPRAQPGRQADLTSKQQTGEFKIIKAVFTGDTWGPNWYVDVEARPIG